jgi:DHA1 family bicyclomycin/chloramphenicol resistance-like MFS transporter
MKQTSARPEFVALMAAMFATIALSIDAMLPALPEIAASLSPTVPNRAQLVITSFVLGMGLGTLFAGPLSDRYGRKPVILAGMALYICASVLAWAATSLELLLAARVLQGFAAAAPRVVSMAMVRDLYSGTTMARILSFVMMVFTLIPAMAPLMGQGMIYLAGWQAIFLFYIGFALLLCLWLWTRQPETLAPQSRRPLNFGTLWSATVEVMTRRTVILAILAQTLTLGMLFATLSSMHGIFADRFDRAASFPLWFALIAVLSMSGSIINARYVRRFGMLRMLRVTYAGQAMITLAMLIAVWTGLLPDSLAFPLHILWSIGLFAMMGVTNGNLSSMAMEPLGHIAGLAASVISSIATVGSVLLAVPVGLLLDGTQMPLLTGVTLYAAAAFGLMLLVRKPA